MKFYTPCNNLPFQSVYRVKGGTEMDGPNRLEELVNTYETTLYRAALAILGDAHEAEDAVQDAFLRCLEKAPDFESPAHARAWLLRVTVNGCKSRLRAPWRRRTAPLLDAYPAAAPEEAETRFSYSGQKQSWIIELDEDVLELSPGLNFLDIAPDSPSAGLRALWAELSAQTSPLPGDETYTEHNGLISIKREIQLADYLTDFPLSVDRLVYTAWAADREFGTSQYDTSINAEELTRRFRAYFPIPVPEGLAMEISMTPDASGQLLSACFLTLDSSLLTLQADCVSTGEGVLFALCAGGSMAKALDGSGIPGGWGIYRLSPGGDLETVYSIPNGGRAMAFWSDGDGTLFLLTEEKGAFLLTLLDVDTLTPVATQELFPAAEGAPHPQVFPQSDGSFCLLSAGDFLAVLNRRSGAWVVDFTADTSLQSSLGCPLSTPSSRLSLCYDGTRLAITGPCPSTKSEYFLAVYTADGLEYLGGYTSSLYGNHPPDCYPWGSWQDGSCRSIALEPSLPGTETAS